MYLLLSIHRNCFSEDIPLWQADWVEPVPSASKANVLATTLEGNWFQMLKNKAYEVLTVLLSKQFSLVTDIWLCVQFSLITGKSLSQALILSSTNPQYDNRLFIKLPVQYMKITTSEHVVYTNCFLFLFWHSEQSMYTTCFELEIFIYWTFNSMNNLLSYYGLVDARISAAEKDLPVSHVKTNFTYTCFCEIYG